MGAIRLIDRLLNLTDVDISNLQDEFYIAWDEATSKLVFRQLDPTLLTGTFSTNKLVYATGVHELSSTGIYWDSINNRLGFNTTTPTGSISVVTEAGEDIPTYIIHSYANRTEPYPIFSIRHNFNDEDNMRYDAIIENKLSDDGNILKINLDIANSLSFHNIEGINSNEVQINTGETTFILNGTEKVKIGINDLRLASAYSIVARNNANTADITLIGLNPSDQTSIGGSGEKTVFGTGGIFFSAASDVGFNLIDDDGGLGVFHSSSTVPLAEFIFDTDFKGLGIGRSGRLRFTDNNPFKENMDVGLYRFSSGILSVDNGTNSGFGEFLLSNEKYLLGRNQANDGNKRLIGLSSMDHVSIASSGMISEFNGPVFLAEDPTLPLHAVTKQYADSLGGGSNANTSLSNLITTSINSSLLFQTGLDIGSTGNPVRDIYLYGGAIYGSGAIKITTSSTTGNFTATFPANTGVVAETNLSQTWSAIQIFSVSPRLNNTINLVGRNASNTSDIPIVNINSSDRLSFAENGDDSIFSGRIGIGAVPVSESRLYVLGDASNGANVDIRSVNTTTPATVEVQRSDYGSTFKSAYLQYHGASAVGSLLDTAIPKTDLAVLAFQESTNSLIYSTGPSDIIFGTNSLERFRMSGAGNFRFGTPNFPTGGAKNVIQLGNAIPPTGSSIADSVSVYAYDFAAGDSRLYARYESMSAGSPVALLGLAQTFTAAQIISSNSSSAFSVGPNGDTNPSLRVAGNVASQVTGILITPNTAGNGIGLSPISTAANEDIVVTSKGAGTIRLRTEGGVKISSTTDTNSTTIVPTVGGILRLGSGSLRLAWGSNTGNYADIANYSDNESMATGLGFPASNQLGLYTNSVRRTFIDASGSLSQTAVSALTNSVNNTATIIHNTSDTPTNGFGVGFIFKGKSSTTNSQDMSQIATVWTTATHASRTSDLVFYTVNNAAALAEAFRLRGNKSAKFSGSQQSSIVTLVDAAPVAIDASQGSIFYLSTATDRTIDVPTNPPTSGESQKIHIYVKNTDSVDHTITLTTGSSNSFRFGLEITTISAVKAGKTSHIACIWHAGDSKWDVLGNLSGY